MNLQPQNFAFTRHLKAKRFRYRLSGLPGPALRLFVFSTLAALILLICPWLALVLLSLLAGKAVYQHYFKSGSCTSVRNIDATDPERRHVPGSLSAFPINPSQRYLIRNATVIFADLVGFTALCRQLGDTVTVDLLDALFWQLDTQCLHHGVRKIKTTGDGYIAVAGLLSTGKNMTCDIDLSRHHVQSCINLAGSMLSVTESLAKQYGLVIQMRIGIATGPIIVDTLGRVNRQTDIWGNTVNCAACLEQSALPGTISVCPLTRRFMSE